VNDCTNDLRFLFSGHSAVKLGTRKILYALSGSGEKFVISNRRRQHTFNLEKTKKILTKYGSMIVGHGK
jgi:hypothetical protein